MPCFAETYVVGDFNGNNFFFFFPCCAGSRIRRVFSIAVRTVGFSLAVIICRVACDTTPCTALLLRILRIQLGIRQQQREVLQEGRQLKHKRKHLLQIGGRGLREIGVNAMKAVLAHDVQVLYSLHGRKGKRAFVNLRLCRLATDVICQKAGCDQAEVLNFIKRWLPGSGDRCGGRKRHFREAFVVEQPDDPHSQSADYRLLAAAGFLPSHSSQGLDSTTVTVPPTQPDLQ
ncbi:uncharacterized protein LOC142765280 isoform X1 [Rhipicephalus microplus]|uniref:uncharacterized protein LOC142765280 isoform X1 n=1 Tax=Rhipicephalus microplus TaxID=6941 RepID=UPI003F6D5A81